MNGAQFTRHHISRVNARKGKAELTYTLLETCNVCRVCSVCHEIYRNGGGRRDNIWLQQHTPATHAQRQRREMFLAPGGSKYASCALISKRTFQLPTRLPDGSNTYDTCNSKDARKGFCVRRDYARCPQLVLWTSLARRKEHMTCNPTPASNSSLCLREKHGLPGNVHGKVGMGAWHFNGPDRDLTGVLTYPIRGCFPLQGGADGHD